MPRPVVMLRVGTACIRHTGPLGNKFTVLGLWGEVIPRRESAAVGPQDDDADRFIMLRLFHRVVYFTAQRVTQRIELLRPVERDERQAVVSLVFDVVVFHRILQMSQVILEWRNTRLARGFCLPGGAQNRRHFPADTTRRG